MDGVTLNRVIGRRLGLATGASSSFDIGIHRQRVCVQEKRVGSRKAGRAGLAMWGTTSPEEKGRHRARPVDDQRRECRGREISPDTVRTGLQRWDSGDIGGLDGMGGIACVELHCKPFWQVVG